MKKTQEKKYSFISRVCGAARVVGDAHLHVSEQLNKLIDVGATDAAAASIHLVQQPLLQRHVNLSQNHNLGDGSSRTHLVSDIFPAVVYISL